MDRSRAIRLISIGLVLFTSVIAGIYFTKLAIAPTVPTGPKAIKPSSTMALLFDAVGNKVTDKFVFTDQDGKSFDVSQWFDKPLIISFMFTKCPAVCPTITASLSAFAERNKGALGERFRIISIGFDAENDTPEAMNSFGEQFTESFESWKFLSGDSAMVKSLANRLGVTYKRGPSGEWLHTVGVTLMAPGGVVLEQVLGQDYSDRQLLPLLARIEKEKK